MPHENFMVITFEFPDQPIELVIKLLDNPGVQSWANSVLSVPRTAQGFISSNTVSRRYNQEVIATQLEICAKEVRELAKFGYEYPNKMPATPADINRSWCNSLHRFFTHTQQTVNVRDMSRIPSELSTLLRNTLTTSLQNLNDAIHAIEVYLPADIDYEPEFSFDEIYCSEEPAFSDPGWWRMDDAHRQYHSLEHASVIFGPQILGKSILRSYLDGDDPSDWDTTGHYSNNGSLLIQVSDFRQRVYNSDSFKQWLARWGMTPEQVIYDYPVGTIQDQDLVQIIHKKLQGNKRVNTTYKKLH
jgi:hypothetical protein